MRLTSMLTLLLLCTLCCSQEALATDPNQRGPYSVGSEAGLVFNNDTLDPIDYSVFYPGSGATLDNSGGPYPVVMLNHGFQLTKSTLFGYAEHLASHGFICIVPERFRLQFNTPPLVSDLQYMLDWMETQAADTNSRYYQAAQTDNVGMAGHSAGGRLSFWVASLDSRVKAVVGLDPVDSSAGGTVASRMPGLYTPFLVFGTDVQQDTCNPRSANFTTIYDPGNGPKMEIITIGGDHCALLSESNIFCSVCPQGTNIARQYELTLRYTTAFLLHYLKGDQTVGEYLWDGSDIQAETTGGAITVRFDRQAQPSPTPSPTTALTNTPSPTATPSTPTLTPTPTGTPTATSTPVPEIITDIEASFADRNLVVTLDLRNSYPTAFPVYLYVAVEVAGSFYFLPGYTEAATVLRDFSLSAGYRSGLERIVFLHLAESLASPLPVTWFAALLDKRDLRLLGELDSSPVTLR